VDSFAWADGELLAWLSKDKGDRAIAKLGNKFEKDQRVPVKVETFDNLTDKFQSVANKNKGPEIVFWAHCFSLVPCQKPRQPEGRPQWTF
jgi:maltose-binding protein MalE